MPVVRQYSSMLFTTFIRCFSVFSLGAFRYFESKLGHLSNKKTAIPVFAKDCGFEDTTRGRPHPIVLRFHSLSWASLAEDSLTVQSAPSACFHRANHSHSIVDTGLSVKSHSTLLIPGTSAIMRSLILQSISHGISTDCAVTASTVLIARSTAAHPM